jgi:hypothetical protein
MVTLYLQFALYLLMNKNINILNSDISDSNLKIVTIETFPSQGFQLFFLQNFRNRKD